MKTIKTIFAIFGIACLAATVGCAGSPSPEDADVVQMPVTELEVKQVHSSEWGTPLIAANGFVYYRGDGGFIYEARLGNRGKARILYQLRSNEGYAEDGYAFLNPAVFGDIPILNQRVGGATMGSSYSTVVLADGSLKHFDFDVSAYIQGEDYDVVVGYSLGSGIWGHLQACTAEEDEFYPLGEENDSFGVLWIETQDSLSGGPVTDLAVIGHDAYTIGQRWTGEELESSGLYKVNIETNQAERIVDQGVQHFQMDGEYIFFIGDDALLYKMKKGKNNPEQMSGIKMNDFFILGNEIYYIPYSVSTTVYAEDGTVDVPEDLQEPGLYRFSDGENLIPGADLAMTNMAGGYLTARAYNLETGIWQGLIVDNAGNVYKSDPVFNIEFMTIYEGTIWEFVS